MCRIAPLRVGFRVGFFSRLGVAAAPVAGVFRLRRRRFVSVDFRLLYRRSGVDVRLRPSGRP